MPMTKLDQIQNLLSSNPRFLSLHRTHETLKSQIDSARSSLATDPLTVAALKKQKLLAKDRMEAILRAQG